MPGPRLTAPPPTIPSLRSDGGARPSDGPRWWWAILKLDPTGRLLLPGVARRALGLEASSGGGAVTVRAVWRGVTLQLRPAGVGVPVAVDRRGRVLVPVWLRQAVDPSGSVVVATGIGVEPVVLVAPVGVLDGLGDVLVGER